MPLRDFCVAQGWEIVGEYVDHAPANDQARRVRWRGLLDDSAKKRFTLVLVFRLDRAFRSVKHMHDTLAAWELVGVSFKSLRVPARHLYRVGPVVAQPAGFPG